MQLPCRSGVDESRDSQYRELTVLIRPVYLWLLVVLSCTQVVRDACGNTAAGDTNDSGSYRTWTSAEGERTAEGILVAYRDGYVTLRDKSGRTVNGPLGRLSEADREYVRTVTDQVGATQAPDASHYVAMVTEYQEDSLTAAREAIEAVLVLKTPPAVDASQFAAVLLNTHEALEDSLPHRYAAMGDGAAQKDDISPETYVWGYRYVWRRGCFGRWIRYRERVLLRRERQEGAAQKDAAAAYDAVARLEAVERTLATLGEVAPDNDEKMKLLKQKLLEAYRIISSVADE
jgi:hypothetical protein